MAYGEQKEIVASAARTANGDSGSQSPGAGKQVEAGETIALFVDLTAISGAGATLALAVEWSPNGQDWFTPEAADTFTSLTAAAKKVKTFERKAPFYRVVWTITGTTPSITFAMKEYLLT